MNQDTSTPVQKFDDVFSCGDSEFLGLRGGPASHEAIEISARELPLEGLGDPLIVSLETKDTGSDGVLGREVGRSERFALENGEVDLDLIQPTGVCRQMHEGEVVELALEAVHGAPASVDRAAIHDPEHTRRAER